MLFGIIIFPVFNPKNLSPYIWRIFIYKTSMAPHRFPVEPHNRKLLTDSWLPRMPTPLYEYSGIRLSFSGVWFHRTFWSIILPSEESDVNSSEKFQVFLTFRKSRGDRRILATSRATLPCPRTIAVSQLRSGFSCKSSKTRRWDF